MCIWSTQLISSCLCQTSLDSIITRFFWVQTKLFKILHNPKQPPLIILQWNVERQSFVIQGNYQKIITPSYSTAAAATKSLQSCLTLCDPIDGNPPVSSVLGIFQARVLVWVAVAFSSYSTDLCNLQFVVTRVMPWDT